MTKADRVHSTPQTAAPAEHLLEKRLAFRTRHHAPQARCQFYPPP